tara:strand:- start:400 stop:1650 length:1251 start_codon:yes stop_codon:yes gene_type:complete
MTNTCTNQPQTATQIGALLSAMACSAVCTASVYDYWYPDDSSQQLAPWYIHTLAAMSMTSTSVMNVSYYFWTIRNFQYRFKQGYEYFLKGHINAIHIGLITLAGILQMGTMYSSCRITIQASPTSFQIPIGVASVILTLCEAMSRCNAVTECFIEYPLIFGQSNHQSSDTESISHRLYHRYFKRWHLLNDYEKSTVQEYISGNFNDLNLSKTTPHIFYKMPSLCLPGIAICINFIIFYALNDIWKNEQHHQDTDLAKILVSFILSLPSLMLSGLFLNDSVIELASLHSVLQRHFTNSYQATLAFGISLIAFGFSFAGFTFLAEQCLKSPPYSSINDIVGGYVLASAGITSVLSNGYTGCEFIIQQCEPESATKKSELHQYITQRLFHEKSSNKPHNTSNSLSDPLIGNQPFNGSKA